MKVDIVHISSQQPHIVLQAGGSYVLVESQSCAAIGATDEISGDLSLIDVKWLLNLTRSTLVNIKVLGRYSALAAAQQAAILIEPATPVAVPENRARQVNRASTGSRARPENRERSPTTHRNTVENVCESAIQASPVYLASDARRPRQQAVSR